MARFDCAVWRPIAANTGGLLAPNLGLILHHAVANGSLYDFFNSPSAGVSAHFWVGLDGRIEQYVYTDVVAWHGMNLNSRYCGVETEGCSAPPHDQPMTAAMVDGLARLYAEGHRRHGWPMVTAEADGQPGFGYHRMAVSTACPCQVRLNMRAEILARAGDLIDGAPAPPASQQEDNMVLEDPATGGYWCADADGAVYAYDRAPYLGGVNNPAMNAGGHRCAGIAAFHDGNGAGYTLVLDFGDSGGDRFRRYRFPRDGSARL
jgi:hypothetical protein